MLVFWGKVILECGHGFYFSSHGKRQYRRDERNLKQKIWVFFYVVKPSAFSVVCTVSTCRGPCQRCGPVYTPSVCLHVFGVCKYFYKSWFQGLASLWTRAEFRSRLAFGFYYAILSFTILFYFIKFFMDRTSIFHNLWCRCWVIKR